MKHKLIGTFLGALLIATVALFGTATPSYAAEEIAKDGITYFLDEQSVTARVYGYDETLPNNITIPESISVDNFSYPVTSIGSSAFSGCTGLESIVLPDSIVNIGNFAFNGCTSLESIVIPDGVESVGDGAFYGCTGLKNVEIPNSVESIGNSAFEGCTGLESVRIPDGVTSIGGGAFYGCTGLESIVLPDSIVNIDNFSFNGCTSLESIVIPDGVESVGDGAFYGCTGLKNVEIPNSVTSIGNSAFSSCTGLESIVLPDSIVNIDNFSFNGCRSLESIVIPDGVESVGMNAFGGCTSLERVVFAGSPTSLDPYAFERCASLQNIFIPNDATLAADAFSDAEGSPLLWRYEVTGDSLDGKVHVKIVSVTDKDGSPITETVSIPQDIMGSGYVIDETPENVNFGQPYNVWVAGIQVTSLNADDVLGSADEGATVVYDASTGTLKLDGANIEMTDGRYAIYAEQDLALELSGTNSVTLSGTAPIEELEWSDVDIAPDVTAAIACKGSLTVKSGDGGQGTLTASIDAAIYCDPEEIDSYLVGGIVATGTVSIEDAEVEATSADSYAYTTYHGVTDASFGILAGEGITVSGARVDASSGEASRSAGIIAPTGDINLNGNIVTVGNGTSGQQDVDFEFSAGVYAYDGTINITGGSVDAHAADHSSHVEAYGICGANGVSITGGKVVAGGTESNVDAVEPDASVGISSIVGNVVISGKDTSVEADGGFARHATIGIGAQSGNVLITDATVKAAAQNEPSNEDGIAAGIVAYRQIMQPMSTTSRSGSDTGNIALTGADVQAIGITAPVIFNGSLTVGPAESMRYAVDALDQMVIGYPELPWDEMAAAAQGIQGSPFTEETSLDEELVSDSEYLHFYNVAPNPETNPEGPDKPSDVNPDTDPENPSDPEDQTVPEEKDEPVDSSTADNTNPNSIIPETGDSSLIVPGTLAASSVLAIGAATLIRKSER